MRHARLIDSCLRGILCGISALILIVHVGEGTLPYEDAAILMRYIDHLAEGYGIVWNPGEAPVDGATDFLFLLLTAGIQRLGLSTEQAVRLLISSAHIASCLLIYEIWRKENHSFFKAFWAALCLALGPATAYFEAFFATSFFGFWVTLTACLVHLVRKSPDNPGLGWLFAGSCLLMGLSRPEGVFLSAFMLGSMLLALAPAYRIQLLRKYLICVVGIGGIYFFWHLYYFGYALPNPFYKKGGGALYPFSLWESLKYAVILLCPLALIGAISGRSKPLKKEDISVLLPILGFTVIWVLLSNEMNYFMRFQYALLPMGLVHLALFVRPTQNDGLTKDGKHTISLLLMFASLVYYACLFPGASIQKDGRYAVARILNAYADHGYTLATTEAGLLPYYSAWRSLDTWGLNDHHIATHGVITMNYLDKYRPDVLMYDEFEGKAPRGSTWTPYLAMIDTLAAYAQEREYVLAGKFSVPAANHFHVYYVKPGLSISDTLISQIRSCTYPWYESGEEARVEF